MDKRSILALILITGVIIVWMFFQSIEQKPIPPDEKFKSVLAQDSTKNKDSISSKIDSSKTKATDSLVNTTLSNKYGAFAKFTQGKEDIIEIENSLTKIKLSTKGAVLKKFYLKNYKNWAGKPVQLINSDDGDLYLSFRTMQNILLDSRDLYFNVNANQKYYSLGKNDTLTLQFELAIDEYSKIIKKLTFNGNSYIFSEEITLENMEKYIPNRGYKLTWGEGLRFQEHNSVDEASSSHAIASLNGDIEELDASSKDEPKQTSVTGLIDYAAVKIKYFTVAIIPQPYKTFDGTVDMSGEQKPLPDNGVKKIYTVEYRLPYSNGVKTNKFNIYLGPLDYKITKEYNLEALVDLGFRFGIRQIGEYFMLPIFKFIHNFVPNYGIAIIIFSILMKFLLYPLSIQQMRSSQKMQVIAPLMNEIREKYKDDQTKQQKEIMKVYSEYGINPAGGCLPLLLQMPILYALWAVLKSAIDLRQANFALWITDLSVPDTILHLPFSLLGINQISGLALLMGATLFIQQKQTITDPRQKSMVYIMPVMLTLLFNYLPSGLNLYYFTFNILSIGMQVYMNKYSKNKLTLADLKKMPKKEGWMQRKMREAQELAEQQGKTLPGMPKTKPTSKNLPNKPKKK
ncbi:MAG: membrane protein insertase YidC [Candidatus Kapaibacteriota bacterium]